MQYKKFNNEIEHLMQRNQSISRMHGTYLVLVDHTEVVVSKQDGKLVIFDCGLEGGQSVRS